MTRREIKQYYKMNEKEFGTCYFIRSAFERRVLVFWTEVDDRIKVLRSLRFMLWNKRMDLMIVLPHQRSLRL
jgi:hypothetical protein